MRSSKETKAPPETTSEDWSNLPWRKLEQHCYRLQKRIFKASERGNQGAVHRLQQLLMRSRSARLLAVRRVSQDNQGKKTAGIDGIASITPPERLALAEVIHPQQQRKRKAQPVRRVWIPKPGKPDERRPLGIPTMYDRARQALAKQALEPEWEARFEPNSYGFRLGRGCHDAIKAIFLEIQQKAKYVLDADIRGCFDHIDQTALLGKLAAYPAMRQAIKGWLKAGIMGDSGFTPSEEGTPQGGVITPPTMLQTLRGHGGIFFVRGRVRAVGADPEDHPDLALIDLDPFDQGADDLAAGQPIRRVQACCDVGRKLLKATKHERQLRFQTGFIPGLLDVRFQVAQALAQSSQPGFKLCFVNQPFGVAINQACHPLAHPPYLAFQWLQIRRCLGLQQPSPVFLLQPLRMLQQPTDLLPDRLIHQIGAQLLVPAQAHAPKAVGISADTAVVRIRACLLLAGARTDRLAVISIPATAAHQQPLQQIARSAAACSRVLLILLQLLGHRLEERSLHQSRDGNAEPLVHGFVPHRVGFLRLQAPSALRSQAGAQRFDGRFAKRRFALVSGVFEDAPDRGPVPGGFAGARALACRNQPPLDFPDGAAIPPHPGEDLAHDPRFLQHHVQAGCSCPILLAHVAVAVGRTREDAHTPDLRRMPFAAAAALQDFGAFILGNHTLDLKQELVLRSLADFPIEKDHLHACPQELLQQQDLMGVVARQPIRTMDIEVVNAPRCGDIAESFQRWADQGGAAVAIIHKLQFWSELEPPPRDAGTQVGYLALNRPGFLLHIRGDASIDGRLGGAHGSFLSACGALGEITGASTARRRPRCRTGTSWSYACWIQACSRRLGSNMLCTSNGVRVLPGLVAMGFHAIPWECTFAGRITTERRPLKPLPVGGAKAAARDVLLQLKLYQLFCNIVGGVISPLLANIALHGMEEALKKAYTGREGKPALIRYADDFCVFHPTLEGVIKAREIAEQWLHGIGLELNPKKTRITHTLQTHEGNVGFDFLGVKVRQHPAGKTQSGKNSQGKPLGFKTRITRSQGCG